MSLAKEDEAGIISMGATQSSAHPMPSPGGDGIAGIGIDCLVPREMAQRAAEVGVSKAHLPFPTTAALGVLAGAFIALGAMLSTVVTSGSGLSFGISRLLGGLVFSLGLLLVVVGGAELFTGNNLIVMAFASRRIGARALAKNWLVVFTANFGGAICTALLVFWSVPHGKWCDRTTGA
jgi:formate transporter